MLSVGKVTLWASKRVFRRVFLRGRVFVGDLQEASPGSYARERRARDCVRGLSAVRQGTLDAS